MNPASESHVRIPAAGPSGPDEWELGSDPAGLVFNALSAHIAILREDGTIIAANDAWRRATRDRAWSDLRPPVGANYLEHCRLAAQRDPTWMASILEGLQDVIHGAAREFGCEYPCQVSDQRRWFLLHAAVVERDENRIVISHTEITARRSIEERTTQQGLRRQAMFRSAGEGFCIIDRIGRILEANRMFSEMVGYTEAELLQMRFHQVAAGVEESAMVRIIDGVLAHGPDSLQIRYQPRVGLARDGEIRANPVRMDGQDVLFLSMRDVTEWKHQAEQRHMLLSMLDQAREGIALWDLEGRFCYLNQAAERLSGCKREEALGKSAARLANPGPAQFAAAMKELLARGEWHGELGVAGDNGETRFWESWWTLIRDELGQPSAVLSINADVTERKALQAELLRAQRHESVGALVLGIAHDLNNILSPIVMGLPLLRSEMAARERDQMACSLEASAQRAVGVVRQLLDFGRDGARDNRPLDLRAIMHELVRMAEETFSRSVAVLHQVPPDLWSIAGNAAQVHQMLLNLCVNARDAMPGGGVLSLRAENIIIDEQFVSMNPEARPGPYVRVRVEDTGEGMSDEVRARIFDPFFTTRGSAQAAGLGLTSVLGSVKEMGGFLQLESRPREGTTFDIFLPAFTEPSAAEEGGSPGGDVARAEGELILVVDDEPNIRQATRRTLERHGYRVIEAADGVEATAIYADHMDEIDLVITDIMMPVMDGLVLCRTLRRLNAEVRLLVSTGLPYGKDDDSITARLAEINVSHVLLKPHTGQVLLRAIDQVLGRLHPAAGSAGGAAAPAPPGQGGAEAPPSDGAGRP